MANESGWGLKSQPSHRAAHSRASTEAELSESLPLMSSRRLLIRARVLSSLIKLNGRKYPPCLLNRWKPIHVKSEENLVLSKRYFCSEEHRESTSFNVQDYEDFRERVLSSEKPVIVDFHAEWCAPCRSLGPRLESLVDGRDGRILLAKVDVDDNQDLAMDYGVQAVPTVLAFKNGEKISELIGAVADAEIRSMLNNVLNEDE